MSGRKNVLVAYPVVTNGDMSQTITSSTTNIRFQDHIWYQMKWTGAPVGTFYIDGSDDGADCVLGILSLDLGSVCPASMEITPTAAHFVRLRFVPSSGSGTLQVRVSGKMA